ncbi:MAG: heparinase II/III family protein [Sphingomonas sp.]
MTRAERVETETGETEIEPGKRLIRIDDAGGSWLGRMGYRLHRFVWRTPLHQIRLRGKMPLRLLAVPKDPVAGDKAAGEAILDGRILRHGQELRVDAVNFVSDKVPRAFADHLQCFAWLRDLAAATTRERGAKTAEMLMRRWLAAHGEAVAEPAWRADLWGRRILFWTAYAPYILSSRDPIYRSAVLRAFARGARHLDRGADRAPLGLARIAAWSGVIAAALVLQGGPARLASGEAGLARALRLSLHDDGGLISRSPIEQLRLVEILAQLRAVYLAARRDVPDWLMEALPAAAAALLAVTLGDDALSSWQGGNMGERRRVIGAIEAAGSGLGVLRRARGWGYQRLQAKQTVVVFDAAPPPPARAFAGGCASTLAFELSDGEHRLVVNCGGQGGPDGRLSPGLAQALRTTAACSTLTLGDRNSTAIHEDGMLGKGVVEVEMTRDDTGGAPRAEASHDGYARRFGLIHERRLALTADGRHLTGEDRLYPAAKRRRRAENSAVAIRFHLGPAVEATTTADGHGALLRVRGGGVWQFRCRGGRLDIEESLWIDGERRPQPTQMLSVTAETPPDGMTISWELARAG